MFLRQQYTVCIWCGKRLVNYTPQEAGTFGPRPRSDEHVIPRNLFGRIMTTDLCAECNSEFGRICDKSLTNDPRIVTAAGKAGIKLTDLRQKFEGKQRTTTGGTARILYQDGRFVPLSQLAPAGPLMVPASEWSKRGSQTRGALIAKVRKKHLPLSVAQIEAEVDELMRQVNATPSGRHYNSTIDEGFDLTVSTGPVEMRQKTSPWETEWCLAKIVFELSRLAWPTPYRQYCREVIDFFRRFIRNQAHNAQAGTGTGIFTFTELPAKPARKHEITSVIAPTCVRWELTFFGTARWSWGCELRPVAAPPGSGWRIVAENPFGSGNIDDASLECTPLEEK
jgi:hypothetical protein